MYAVFLEETCLCSQNPSLLHFRRNVFQMCDIYFETANNFQTENLPELSHLLKFGAPQFVERAASEP